MAEDLTPEQTPPEVSPPLDGTDGPAADASSAERLPATRTPGDEPTAVSEPTAAGGASQLGPLPRHDSAGRFRLIKIAMAVAAVVIIFIASGTLGANRSATGSSGDGWSSWAPSASGPAAAQQIADHVGPQYRGSDGKQLVAVTGSELKVANLPVRIAVRNGQGDGSIEMVSGSGLLYTLCGLGQNCSIENGKPSVERMMLLRREGLELALYSFHSDPDLENVAVMMPPRPGTRTVKLQDGTEAQVGNQGAGLLFRRSQLEAELEKPLNATVPDRTPTIAEMASSPEADSVEKITDPSLFMVSIKQGQDASAYLVFDPMG